jgi:NAD-dependent deacetylase
MNKKKLVVFSGAGLDKESGIKTFRDCKDGLWNDYSVDDVATPAGWKKDREKVLDFYNERRAELENVEPNDAHRMLVELEKQFDVTHVTQNVSDLLERAGSTNVLHLHGELTKVRGCMYMDETSTMDTIYDVGYKPTEIGDKCETTGSQLRPHIVWFGEMPNNVEESYKAIGECDILLIIGTTLFIEYTTRMLGFCRVLSNPNMGKSEVFFIDPEPTTILDHRIKDINYIKEPATVGVKKFVDGLSELVG